MQLHTFFNFMGNCFKDTFIEAVGDVACQQFFYRCVFQSFIIFHSDSLYDSFGCGSPSHVACMSEAMI